MRILTITSIIAATVVLVKVIDVAVPRAGQRAGTTHVDTLRVVTTVYDSTTVISHAADTVRVFVKQVGPLSSRDLARLICGADQVGDGRFHQNAYGMVFCPVEPKDVK